MVGPLLTAQSANELIVFVFTKTDVVFDVMCHLLLYGSAMQHMMH